MANLMPSPTKYHPSEWHTSNKTNYKQSETERTRSERLRSECNRLSNEVQQTTFRVQKEVEHKLSQRIDDITFWKEELEKKIKQTSDEIEAVINMKIELEKNIEATNFPLEVTKRCLMFRENRQAIDLVHDEVEIQLMKEMEVIEGIQCLLQKTHDEALEQLRLLRSCKYKLEKDTKDKFGALHIDKECATLTDNSPGIRFSPASVDIQTKSILPVEWQDISDVNICKAEQERISSTTLRGVISSILSQTKQDMMRQREIVNEAFYKRIQEVTDAKVNLEAHLKEVIKEIASQEQNIASLQQAIHDKTGPMQLSQTRLDLRSYRPNNELVRDPAQYELAYEVKEIEFTIQKLQEHYLQAQATLKKLNRNQLVLEEDISIKTLSLSIDNDQCMSLRRQMHTK